MAHVGTLDIDIALDAAALKGDNEYKALIESLMEHGYAQRTEFKKFQLVRQVDPKDGGPPIDVIVDFLMPRDVKLTKNKPALIDNFAVQRADGADLALRCCATPNPVFQFDRPTVGISLTGDPQKPGGTRCVKVKFPRCK
jgi:hypothetical protein